MANVWIRVGNKIGVIVEHSQLQLFDCDGTQIKGDTLHPALVLKVGSECQVRQTS